MPFIIVEEIYLALVRTTTIDTGIFKGGANVEHYASISMPALLTLTGAGFNMVAGCWC